MCESIKLCIFNYLNFFCIFCYKRLIYNQGYITNTFLIELIKTSYIYIYIYSISYKIKIIILMPLKNYVLGGHPSHPCSEPTLAKS